MDLAKAIELVQGAIWKQARQWKGHEDDMAQEITLKLITAYREQWDESKSSWTTYVGNRIRFIALDCAREMKLIKRQTLKAWASFTSLDALQKERFEGNRVNDDFTPADPHDDLAIGHSATLKSTCCSIRIRDRACVLSNRKHARSGTHLWAK